ncbi:MAG: hypothetical protein R3E31_29415 [Chloroflexota bacterium]
MCAASINSFLSRVSLNTPAPLTYQNPGSSNAATVALTAAFEQDSFYFAPGRPGADRL